MSQALDGYRIVDFTQVFAGPFATQQLAQLGAEVIKVEQPGVGDMTRSGIADPAQGSVQPGFLACNLGKKSLTLNLKEDSAIEVVRRLVMSADALVENFRPGVMKRLGLDYDTVYSWQPNIVYCSISGYGQAGPNAGRPAFDGAIQAASGMMSLTGHPDVGPLRTGYYGVDFSTAMNAAFAITAALLRRERTGKGQHIDVAMMDTALALIAPQLGGYYASGRVPELLGNRSPTGQPSANVFATADGYLQVVGLRDAHAAKILELLGLADLAERFPTARDRIKNFDEIDQRMHERFLTSTSREWLQLLLEAGVPVSEVRALPDVAEDPQHQHRQAIAEVPIASGEQQRVRTVTGAHVANEDGPKAESAPPRLGEHTRELLRSLEFDEAEITALLRTHS